MSNYAISGTILTGIANKIRAKGGASGGLQVQEFESAIENIPSGGGDELIYTLGSSADATEGSISLDLSGYQLKSIRDYGFYMNRLIKSVKLPSTIRTIGQHGFRNCSYLRSVNFEELTSLTSIGANGFASTQIQNVKLPASVTTLGEYSFSGAKIYTFDATACVNLVSTGTYMLYNQPSVTNVYLPDTLQTIDNNAMASCAGIKQITLPSLLKTIGSSAFASSKFTTITLPSSLITIKSSAFSSGSLAEITIPESVTTIEMYAFGYNRSMTTVRFLGKPATLNANTFYSCSAMKNIYVPWSEGEVAGAPWGATSATVHYNYTGG